MMIVVLGRPDSGKSKRAEDIVLEISEAGRRVYLATMEPFGEEGAKRIEKHRKLRNGKGFVTVEKTVDIGDISFPDDATVLLECVSNLVGNEMHRNGSELYGDKELTDYIVSEIAALNKRAGNLVAVTNEFDDSDEYDDDTSRYIRVNHLVNEELLKIADKVERVCF